MVALTFAEKLKTIREQKGLSQYALAKLSWLSKQALSRLEIGGSEPSWETVQRIATALGVDCTAFADPRIELPENEPARPRGRPKKAAPADVEEQAPVPPAQKTAKKRKGK